MQVFISYNHNDRDFAETLKNALEAQGVDVTIDIEALKFGDSFQEFAEKSVRETDFTIFIVSQHSLRSVWVIEEFLLTRMHEEVKQQKKFLPVAVDQVWREDKFYLEIVDGIDAGIKELLELTNQAAEKRLTTGVYDKKRSRLGELRQRVDPLLTRLNSILVADFSTEEKFRTNLPKLIEAIQEIPDHRTVEQQRTSLKAQPRPEIPYSPQQERTPTGQVFICYARQDWEIAKKLCDDLKRTGITSWLDREKLLPGQNRRHAINQAIKESSYVLALLSSHSISIEGYAQKELKEALELSPSQIRIIPVRLDECEPKDERLQDLQCVDLFLSYEEALDLILKVIPPGKQEFTFEIVTINVQGQIIKRKPGKAQQFTADLGNGVILEMVEISEGKFLMGSPETEEGHRDSESPQHEVTVTPLLMGKYPITQKQWKAVAVLPQINRKLDPDPSHFKGARRPVEMVSWHDAVEFCARLSKHTGLAYRLPSEAEWEYACRAGTTTPFYFGETLTSNLANYNTSKTYASEPKGKYRKETTEVGIFPPNAFGLYDMQGNVWEWCADPWHEHYRDAPSDGRVWEASGDDSRRLLRGGSWYDYPLDCRGASRSFVNPVYGYSRLGFRVVVSSAWTLL